MAGRLSPGGRSGKSDGARSRASRPPCHYNPIGTVHGGYAATLLDSAMGCAVHSVLEAGMGYATLEIKVNLVRPITVETGPVRAEGSLLHRGRRSATSQAQLVDAGGKLLAHATWHLPAVSSVILPSCALELQKQLHKPDRPGQDGDCLHDHHARHPFDRALTL
jgi:uncharacterized protein (TIGR00369 family)